jgi:hypothetical protein
MLHGSHSRAAFEGLMGSAMNERRLADFELKGVDDAEIRHWVEFALTTAGDRTVGFAARKKALEMIAAVADQRFVKRILPLLDDETREGEEGLSMTAQAANAIAGLFAKLDKTPSVRPGLCIGDHTANAVARLLGKEERIGDDSPDATRAEFVRKVRAWANDGSEP